jgi:hypothetical protein
VGKPEDYERLVKSFVLPAVRAVIEAEAQATRAHITAEHEATRQVVVAEASKVGAQVLDQLKSMQEGRGKKRTGGEALEAGAAPSQKRAKVEVVEKGLEELNQSSFVRFGLAMAWDTVQRICPDKLTGGNPHLEHLPPRVQQRFTDLRRCSFSWCTDRTSLMLAQKLLAEGDSARALRLTVISQMMACGEGFQALASKRAIHQTDAEHLELGVKAAAGRAKTLMKGPLQRGSLAWVGKGPFLEQCAAKLAALNAEGAFETCALALDKEGVDCLEQLQRKVEEGGLGLPPFKALCVGRVLHQYSQKHNKQLAGVPASCCFLGSGAVDSYKLLRAGQPDDCGKGGKVVPGLGELAAACTKAAQELDGALAECVAELGLPFTVQTWEHLLCEARKVFGSNTKERANLKEGLPELWLAAQAFFQ